MASTFSRRDFIRITAIAGVGVGVSATAARYLFGNQNLRAVIDHRILMGTTATLEIICEDKGFAWEAIQHTFAEMQALEAIFSRFQYDSQLSTLNREGHLLDPARALVTVLDQAKAVSEFSNGAFDVTVEPLLSYYRTQVRAGEPIDPAVVKTLQKRIDYKQIVVEPREIRFLHADTQITLDGIAKGYIIDQGAEILREHGFISVMVEVGGDLQAQGSALNRPWRIEIRSPRPETQPRIGVTELTNHAMASSGDYVNTFTQDFKLHHIIDPRSGLSPTRVAGATVVAHTGCEADALSTTLTVLGPETGLALIETLAGVEALLIDKDLVVHPSSGMLYQVA